MADNDVYQKAGTSVTWTDSTGDLAMTLQNLGTGVGRQGAQKDWGILTTARPTLYHFRWIIEFDTNPVIPEEVELRWKGGDGTNYDNDDGTGDIAVSTLNKFRSLNHISTIIVDEALADKPMSKDGYFTDFNQYGMPAIWNFAADNLQNGAANVCKVIVTPIFDEIQAAA